MNWHRHFGLLLSDFFAGSPFVVEFEKDLSIKKQLLDVVVVRKGRGQFTGALPDGLGNLAAHNLITFKSHQEALDDWALKELTGHYVNYRKQVSPSMDSLLPEDEFRLYAVCARYPHNLAGVVNWQELQAGVYECRRGSDLIRVVVAQQLPQTENNSLLHLLSASRDHVRYGVEHYEQRSVETSSLIYQLFKGFAREGAVMPYTLKDFRRDFVKENMKDFTPEERLAGMSLEECLQVFSPEEIERFLSRHRREDKPRKRKKKR